MNCPTSTSMNRPRRLRRRIAPVLILAWALLQHSPLTAKERPQPMLNGIWVIEATPPADAIKLFDEYLPTGTKLRLLVEGPTLRAIESNVADELGGILTVLPPITDALCHTGIGMTTTFGNNLCSSEKSKTAVDGQVEFEDALFVFSRLDAEEAAAPENEFFARNGARSGARFVRLSLKYKPGEWVLWLRSTNEMLSECIFQRPGVKNFDSFPMIWRRQPGS